MLTKQSMENKSTSAYLALSEIVVDPGLCVRSVDDRIAEEYAERLEELPPPTVWESGGTYHLLDGGHRLRAHEFAGSETIVVSVLQGSLEDARLFLAGCDARVGLRRSRAAKRVAIRLVLQTEAGAAWSDRRIAEHTGNSHTLVAQVRAEAKLSADTSQSQAPDGAGDVPGGLAEATSTAGSGNIATPTAEEPQGQVPKADGAVHPVAPEGVSTRAKNTTECSELELADREEAADVFVHPQPDASRVEAEELTLATVTGQVEALVAGCIDDDERREVLTHLAEAISRLLGELSSEDDDDRGDQGEPSGASEDLMSYLMG